MNQKFQICLNTKFQLGQGQLGAIYNVLDEKLNIFDQDKVVKVLLKNPEVPKQLLTRKKNLRFDFAFENLINFFHQNCVQFLNCQEFNNHTLILMQKYDENLQTYAIRRNYDFSITEYLLLLNQVTNAYLSLIELGIKYGRFKPQNILVSEKKKEGASFYLADYGFQMIDKDRSETDFYLQVPQIDATEEQDDMYQFGICITQMGINYKMKFKHQLENLHCWLKQLLHFEQILHQAVRNNEIQKQHCKLPPLIMFIINSMVVYNPSKRLTWKDLKQLLQCIKSANPQQLNDYFLNKPNPIRWNIIHQIRNQNQIQRPLDKQQQQIQNIQAQQKEQQIMNQIQNKNINQKK